MSNTPPPLTPTPDDSKAAFAAEVSSTPQPEVVPPPPAKKLIKKPMNNSTFYCMLAVIALATGIMILNGFQHRMTVGQAGSPQVMALRAAIVRLQPYMSQHLADAVAHYNEVKAPTAPEIPAPDGPQDTKALTALAHAVVKSVQDDPTFAQMVKAGSSRADLGSQAFVLASKLVGNDIAPTSQMAPLPQVPAGTPPQMQVTNKDGMTDMTSSVPSTSPPTSGNPNLTPPAGGSDIGGDAPATASTPDVSAAPPAPMPAPEPVTPTPAPAPAPTPDANVQAAGQPVSITPHVSLTLPDGAVLTPTNKHGANVSEIGLVALAGKQIVVGTYTADPTAVTSAQAVQQLITMIITNRKARGEDVQVGGPKPYSPDGKLDGQKFLVSSPIAAQPGSTSVSVYYLVQEQGNIYDFLSTKGVYPQDKDAVEALKSVAAGLKATTVAPDPAN